MTRIAMFGPLGHGHVTPMLGIARELVERGHDVAFAAPGDFESAIGASGAHYHRVESTWESMGRDEIPQMHGADLVRGMGLLLDETKVMVDRLESMPRPEIVVHDGTLAWWGRVLARRWGVPAVETWPNFVGNKHWNMGRYTKINPVSPRFIRTMLRVHRYLRTQGFKGLAETGAFLDGSSAAARIVTVPCAFQPHGETFTTHDFVGPIIADRSFQGEWAPPASGQAATPGDGPDARVLLVSLGTAYNARPEFFRLVSASAAGRPWHVVMAIGDQVKPEELGELPPNVEVHERVPQLAVLHRASAFVTHAGMGSTLEALALGVPMVAVPQMAEQRANADRLEALGLGVALDGDPETLSAESLWEA
ncbi:MAG: macrolide family glycosyltransferase, partial [Pseudoclavibacter sp.]